MRRKALRPVPYRAALAACLLLPFVLAPAAFAQDVDPPVIAVTESGSPLADDSLWNRAVTPVVDVTDASPPVVVDLAMDGLPFTSGSTVSGEGAHQLVVTATDERERGQVSTSVGGDRAQRLLVEIGLLHQPVSQPAQQIDVWAAAFVAARP